MKESSIQIRIDDCELDINRQKHVGCSVKHCSSVTCNIASVLTIMRNAANKLDTVDFRPDSYSLHSNDYPTDFCEETEDKNIYRIENSTFALEKICVEYWPSIYKAVRRRGYTFHEAQDLTQAFFEHLFEKKTLNKMDWSVDWFGFFMIGSLGNFLNNELDKRQTWKRGGRHQIISLDDMKLEEAFIEDVFSFGLERQWALRILETIMLQLEKEYAVGRKINLFFTIKPGLLEEQTSGIYVEWAKSLNMREGAVRVALHRLRRRFGELVRLEIGRNVNPHIEINHEIRHLFASVSNCVSSTQ